MLRERERGGEHGVSSVLRMPWACSDPYCTCLEMTLHCRRALPSAMLDHRMESRREGIGLKRSANF